MASIKNLGRVGLRALATLTFALVAGVLGMHTLGASAAPAGQPPMAAIALPGHQTPASDLVDAPCPCPEHAPHHAGDAAGMCVSDAVAPAVTLASADLPAPVPPTRDAGTRLVRVGVLAAAPSLAALRILRL